MLHIYQHKPLSNKRAICSQVDTNVIEPIISRGSSAEFTDFSSAITSHKKVKKHKIIKNPIFECTCECESDEDTEASDSDERATDY